MIQTYRQSSFGAATSSYNALLPRLERASRYSTIQIPIVDIQADILLTLNTHYARDRLGQIDHWTTLGYEPVGGFSIARRAVTPM